MDLFKVRPESHWKWFIAIIPVSLFLIFLLPWYVPVKGPVISESYVFGFSNMTSSLGLALILASIFFIRLSYPYLVSRDRELASGLFCEPVQRSRNLRATMLACMCFSVSVVWCWWSYIPGAYYGECTHFITRLDRMVLGQRPFVDFEYGYGPALLGLPFFIYKSTHGALAIDTSYIISMLIHYVLGILAFGYIVRCLKVTETCRILLLIFATLATLNITLGVIYTPLRYAYALWAVFYLHNSIKSLVKWKVWVIASILPFVGLLLSPDTGLVTCVAFAVGLLSCSREGKNGLSACAFGVLVSVLMAIVFFGFDYFKLVLFFGEGTFNLPVLPLPYILSLIFISCWILPRIAVAGWTGHGDSAPFCISLLFALGLYLPESFGRCDPSHVLDNCLGILIIALAAVFSQKFSLVKAAIMSAVLTIFLTTQIFYWNIYDMPVRKEMEMKNVFRTKKILLENADSIVRSRLEKESTYLGIGWEKKVPFLPDIIELLKYDTLATPIGVTEDIDRFLKVSGRYFNEYSVPPMGGFLTKVEFEKRLELLANTKFVLMPKTTFLYLQPFNMSSYEKIMAVHMSGLYVFPVNLHVVNEPLIPESLIIHKLESSHIIVGDFRDYYILQKKSE